MQFSVIVLEKRTPEAVNTAESAKINHTVGIDCIFKYLIPTAYAKILSKTTDQNAQEAIFLICHQLLLRNKNLFVFLTKGHFFYISRDYTVTLFPKEANTQL